jgi:hypothetical protein
MLSREASLELQQDGGAVAASSITVMAGMIGDSKKKHPELCASFILVHYKMSKNINIISQTRKFIQGFKIRIQLFSRKQGHIWF